MLEITKKTKIISIVFYLMNFIVIQGLSIFPKEVKTLVLTITFLLVLFLSLFLLISFVKKKRKLRNTFWKVLSKKDIETIDNYLEKSFESIRYELRFDIENNYIALSGEPGKPDSFISQQASKQIGNEEINIRNLDQYLLSPENNTVFLYGPPGSGKSTTLYKALMNYKEQFNQKTGYYIPIFIHANDIISLLDNNHSLNNNYSLDVLSFLKATCHKKQQFGKLINVCNKKNTLQFVIIIDALDEFSDKTKRDQLFNFLASLLEKNKQHRWILSCREEEYKPYAAKFKKVSDVRIKPMDLSQVKQLLKKVLENPSSHFSQIERSAIRKKITSIVENQQETFIRSPYYLSLWLYQASIDSDDQESIMPSIRGLHELELQREIARGLDKKGEDPIARVDHSIFRSQQEILSVLSYHLLKSQLSTNSSNHGQLNIKQSDIIVSLSEGHERLKLNLSNKNLNYDSITAKRLRDYQVEMTNKVTIQSKNHEDQDFSEIANGIIKFINTLLLSSNFNNSKEEFVIIISSILEQANKYKLIKLDISQLSFSKFLNQRAGDYLAAKYLEETKKVKNLIQQKNINFWFFRSLAIAIAISDNPDAILDPQAISEDPVLSTATINGLSLVKSNNKKKFKKFIQEFVDNLFLPQNFASDPCAPLRTLRIVTRLSLNDYADYFIPPITVFKKLLKGRDASISDAVAITLMAYVSRNKNNKQYYWRMLFSYFLSKAFKFELSRRSLNSFINVIYKQVHFK